MRFRKILAITAVFILSSCTSKPIKIDGAIMRRPSTVKIQTVEEWLNAVPKPEIFFWGDEEEYARFVCYLKQLGRDVGSFVMPNEEPFNGIDDNSDGFIDNTYGWDGIKYRPMGLVSKAAPSESTVFVHPFLVNHPMPLQSTGATTGITHVIPVAMAFLEPYLDKTTGRMTRRQSPIYVFIPDERERNQFNSLSPSQLEVFGYPMEPCGALTSSIVF